MSSDTSSEKPLSSGLNFQLSTMMFLQYAIWGAWLPLLWTFLSGHRDFTPSQIGNMFAIGAVGAIVAPFIAGQIADRWFNTEKFLGISHILGGILVWQLASLETYNSFLVFSLLYSLIYSPTLSLTNSLAFHHLPDRDRDFGKIRVWGTIGWIVVGIGIGQWLLHQHTPTGLEAEAVSAAQAAGMADAFKLSGLLGIVMGIFCFFLPSTPPAKEEKKSAIGGALDAIRLQPLLTLFLIAVPISCVHQFYFVHTAPFLGEFQNQAEGFIDIVNKIVGVGGGGLMTIGQMAEIGVLAMIPLFAKKYSRKALLCVGIAAYALRMFLFAYGPNFPETLQLPAIILGIAMHGLCFGCFIFVAFMVVDEECAADVRASAQSLFNLVIVGIGIIVGSKVAGYVAEISTVNEVMDYQKLFSVPMWAALVCLLIMQLCYPNKAPATAADGPSDTDSDSDAAPNNDNDQTI
ncbi:MAG: MFS transporter [Limisphaerales bacterium]